MNPWGLEAHLKAEVERLAPTDENPLGNWWERACAERYLAEFEQMRRQIEAQAARIQHLDGEVARIPKLEAEIARTHPTCRDSNTCRYAYLQADAERREESVRHRTMQQSKVHKQQWDARPD
jgi:hypothetical protein